MGAPAEVLGLYIVSDPPTQVCYLCGQRQATTRDHVFPRLLFATGNAPTNLLTLPACLKCNNDLSKDEEIFQQLILSGRALDTPDARKVWETKVRPNLKNEKRRSRHLVLSHIEIRKAVTFHGQQLHDWPVLKVHPETIRRVLGKFARGLYYAECRERLPEDVKIEAWFALDQYEHLVAPEIMPYGQKTVLANNILTYWRAVATDRPAATLTWFVFYRWNVFCVATVPPELQ